MSRVYNFSAGPAVLPEEVLKEAAAEMLDYNGTGMSVMEMSHRSKAFEEIINSAEQDLRDLMNIPDNYKVLFMQGGASQQFAMIPMNFMKNRVADYIITGQWAKKAAKEAEKYGKVNRIASSEDQTFSYIPDCSDLPVSEDADYVYICENNTIYGTKFKELPNTKGKTLIADVSSCFLSEPVDVEKYGKVLEINKAFPNKTNVEFIEIVDKQNIKMRVWERGAGETLACGTGACATAVACNLNGLTSRNVNIELLGGNLQIEWSSKDNHVYMTGPAVTVFEGKLEI